MYAEDRHSHDHNEPSHAYMGGLVVPQATAIVQSIATIQLFLFNTFEYWNSWIFAYLNPIESAYILAEDMVPWSCAE